MGDQPATHHAVALSEAQESFVATVLAASPPTCHVLRGPPGTGKSAAGIELIQRLGRAKPSIRALLLCPAALIQQFAARLSLGSDSVRVEVVDRQRYREMEAVAPIGDSPFAPSTVAILSIELAKHSDVSRGLLATRWDLLVVDEAHHLSGQRGHIVQQLIDLGRVERAVLMSATPIDGLALPRALLTQWPADVTGAFRPSLFRRLPTVPVPYTTTEQSVFRDVDDLAAALVNAGFPLIGEALRSRARSSSYSLERCLHTIRNNAAHGLGLTRGLLDGDNDQPDAKSSPPWLIERVEHLLAAMDEVAVDSKTEALCSLLSARLSSQDAQSAIVVSQYASTVEYLAATLSNRGMSARAVTGRHSPKDFSRAVEGIARPGVTVMTFASMRGLEIPAVRTWVFYEKTDEKRRLLILAHIRHETLHSSIEIFELEELRRNNDCPTNKP